MPPSPRKAVELCVQPRVGAAPWALEHLADPIEGAHARQHRSDCVVVRHVLRGVGKAPEGLVGGEGDELLGVEPLLHSQVEELWIGEEESIFEAGPDGVLDVPLPEHTAERRLLDRRRVLVLHVLAHGAHKAHAHDDAGAGRGERSVLGVEEAQGCLGPHGAEEGVEHDELVRPLLDPGRVEAQLGLSVELEPEAVALYEFGAFLREHPAEGNAGRAEWLRRVGRRREVAVRVGAALHVGMALGQRQRIRRHESGAFFHARRELCRSEISERAACDLDLRNLVL